MIDYKPTIQSHYHDVTVKNQFYYAFYELNKIYQCASAPECADFTTECVNEGYVAVYKGVCTCVCPDGLDPATGCATVETGYNTYKWPSGSYAMIAAEGGCPPGFQLGYRTSWSEGYSWHQHASLSKLAGIQDLSKFEYEFCVSQNSFSSSTNTWSRGNYCILREGGSCPAEFNEGYVQFDDHIASAERNNTASGELPDGVFGADTRLEFCCRTDGIKHIALDLPNETPLVLFQNDISYVQDSPDTVCQEIKNMKSTRYYYTFDNKAGTLARKDGSTPYMYTYPNGNYFLFYFCYYEPVVRPETCGGVIELSETTTTVTINSPNYPSNYDNNQQCFWLIKGPVDSSLLLNFNDFDLGSTCGDTVEIRPWTIAASNRRLCTNDGRTWRSHDNVMTVIFRSNDNTVSGGFSATIDLVLDQENCFKKSDLGQSYRGSVNHTREFEPCLHWSQVKNCRHATQSTNDVNDGLEANYCRNPGDGDRPWCYTSQADCARGFCDVCGVERAFDRESASRCATLKDTVTNFCTKDSRGFSLCRATCSDQLPAITVAPSIGDISCSPPTALPDGTTNGAAKSSYSVGDQVTYTCNTRSTSSVALTCTTDGTWAGPGSACKVCDDGWHAYNSLCYFTHDTTALWSTARDNCVNDGGVLMMPRSEADIEFIRKITHIGREYWVGASDLAVEGTWRWLDGSEVGAQEQRWAAGQPSNFNGWADCALMSNTIGGNTWRDVYCSYYVHYYYVCQKDNNMISQPCVDVATDCQEQFTADGSFCDTDNSYATEFCALTCKIFSCTTGACEEGWTLAGSNCYKYHSYANEKNYNQAVGICYDNGAIVSGVRQGVEKDLVDSLRGSATIWIGANDIGNEGTFTWADESAIAQGDTNWATSEPNNYWNFEHCVKYSGENGVWNDVYCYYYNYHPFVCSKPEISLRVPCDVPATPANTALLSDTSTFESGYILRYKCNTNYWLESGNLNRGCLLSGQVGGSPPVCVLGSEANVLTYINGEQLKYRIGVIPNFANGIFTTSHEQFYIPRGGEIVEWQLYSNKAGPIALLVLRPSGTNYTLVGYNEFNTGGNGEEFFSVSSADRIQVEADDTIGFYIPGTIQSVAADVHSAANSPKFPEHKLRRSVDSPTSTSALVNGQTYQFASEESSDAVIVSLRAVVGPSSL
ncbi:uncharacterized protein LOC126815817 [Patella vulgata]|uniref:uncharacterized protein LOC126815817 n=1 Tax=Patella vulgata TaxID=6465 RepID=UPI0024A87A84|nr:uncharacterized protein LOC126815817 [Patella vulgata]